MMSLQISHRTIAAIVRRLPALIDRGVKHAHVETQLVLGTYTPVSCLNAGYVQALE